MERTNRSVVLQDDGYVEDDGHVEDDDAVAAVRVAPPQLTKLKIIKNLAFISASFLLCFTAVNGSRSLQSSLYRNNLGNDALTVQNMAGLVSNIVVAPVMLCLLNLKWSIVLSLLLNVAYPASNFFPAWYSMFTGAAITGLGGPPLWNAKSAYLTLLGEQYAALSGETPEVVISLFFAIFFTMHRSSMFTGNIISSIIIHRPPSTHVLSDDDDVIIRSLCGAHYCYQDLDAAFASSNGSVMAANSTVDAIYHPTTLQTNLLFAVYALCGLLAIPLAASVDSVSTSDERKEVNIVQALLSILRHMRNPKEMLLLPLSFLNGVSLAFITADYSLGFVTCSIGVDNVGSVIAAFGLAAGIGAMVTGPLIKYVGRKSIFAFGGLCSAAALIGMLVWSPDSHSLATLFAFAGLWGMANTVTFSQLIAFIAVVFQDGPKQAAFACNFLWLSIGLALWHAVSKYMCLHVQIYVIAVIHIVGMAGYVATELILRAEKVKQASADGDQHQMSTFTPANFTVENSTCSVDESRDGSTKPSDKPYCGA